jgi:gluconokinase
MEAPMSEPRSLPVIVAMGVSGSGKTTFGTALARRLGVPYADADGFHPAANIAKMRAGHPLDDTDRGPWLDNVGRWLADHVAGGGVASCSALRRRYRDRLRSAAPDAVFVHLAGPPEVVAARVAARPEHFMPAALVRSQYDSLEQLGPDELGLTLPLEGPVDQLVDTTVAWLARHSPRGVGHIP